MYYLQSRYYDPEVGRFINLDDTEILKVTTGTINGANLYAYCNNDPVQNSDPTGYIAANVIGAIIGAVLGIVGGAFLGKWLANKIKFKNNTTKKAFIIGVSLLVGASAATIGYFCGPYIAKSFKALLKNLRSFFKPRIGTKLGKIGTLTRNTKPVIKGLTKHGLQRMEQRGVSKALAQKIINTGYAVAQNGGKVLYFTKEGVVVLSSAMEVITAYSSTYFDENMKAIVSLFYK